MTTEEKPLTDRVAPVTGGGRGKGQANAVQVASAAARVAVLARCADERLGPSWYLIGYAAGMNAESALAGAGRLLARARLAAGLSQATVASRAGTSRTAVSAYEHGAKSPSLDTVVRLLAGMGFELEARRCTERRVVAGARGRQIATVSPLPRLPVEQALAVVELPLSLNWSEPGRRFDLADRGDRARVYEIVLREGQTLDLLTYVDGALLVDLWNELVLPRDVRAAWAPIVGPLLADRSTSSAIA